MSSRPSFAPSTPRIAALVIGAALLAACQPNDGGNGGNGGNGGQTAGPGLPTTPTAGPVSREEDVISGRVTTAAGAPVAGAEIEVVGYTGGPDLGQHIETVATGADGTYRYEVPNGLYEALGTATLEFEGKTYQFLLDPADGSCEQEMSDAGIVKDFVLRLSGLQMCLDGGVEPDNYLFYHGAPVQLSSDLATAAPHEVVEYTLQPVGALADGSPGAPLAFQRTVAAHTNYFGPIDDTAALYDIPLGRYVVSAALLAPDGRRLPLLVATDAAPTPAQSVELWFEPREVVGTLTTGYVMPTLYVSEGS